jgi:thiamine pyrophosphate-dependent acetolactate synthase large subunit-like protein
MRLLLMKPTTDYPQNPHLVPAVRKKVVAIKGHSAFGFSSMKVETMARFQMDVLIFVINNRLSTSAIRTRRRLAAAR